MEFLKKKRILTGFTLLELIIVIIIVGVLASLAMPRFFRMVERSRSVEALTIFTQIKGNIERCYVMSGGTAGFCPCVMPLIGDVWERIGMEDPDTNPASHFRYIVQSCTMTGYSMFATRNTYDGGTVGMGGFTMTYDNTGTAIAGWGVYEGLEF